MGQVNGLRTIRLRERIKSVRIQATGTQFQNNTPSTITLKAVANNFEAISYAWYKGTGTTVVGTNQNFVIANNQIQTVETYRVVVKNNQNQEYEDSISISKVIDGPQGRPGQLPIQREWRFGDVYRNNDEVIDYIYHRATDSWWKLKPGYNNVVAQINPTNEFVRLNSLEQLAVNILIAENANIAGLIFKNEKLISQSPSVNNPNISIDGKNGKVVFKDANITAGYIGGLKLEDNMLSTEDVDSGIKIEQTWDMVRKCAYIGLKSKMPLGGRAEPILALEVGAEHPSVAYMRGMSIAMDPSGGYSNVYATSIAIEIEGGCLSGFAYHVQRLSGQNVGFYVEKGANLILCDHDNSTAWLELPSPVSKANGYILEVRAFKNRIRVLKGMAALIRETDTTSMNEITVNKGSTLKLMKWGDSWYVM